jgi:hypothetical protein
VPKADIRPFIDDLRRLEDSFLTQSKRALSTAISSASLYLAAPNLG